MIKKFIRENRYSLIEILKLIALVVIAFKAIEWVGSFNNINADASLNEIGDMLTAGFFSITVVSFVNNFNHSLPDFQPLNKLALIISGILFLINQLEFLTKHQRMLLNNDYVWIISITLLSFWLMAIVTIGAKIFSLMSSQYKGQ